MDHHHSAHLPYDQQGHEMAIGHDMHHGGKHNENMINYDQQQQQQAGDSMEMMMMKMFFHFGLGDTVLFQGLIVNSAAKLWLTSVALFLAAILLEMIDYSRGYLSCHCSSRPTAGRHASVSSQSQSQSQSQLIGSGANSSVRHEPDGSNQRWGCCSGSNGPEAGATGGLMNGCESSHIKREAIYFPVRTSDSPMVRFVQASLHFVRTALSLCLMLVAMTYNLCLIFPILLGSAVGFYIFYRPALDSKSVMCH